MADYVANQSAGCFIATRYLPTSLKEVRALRYTKLTFITLILFILITVVFSGKGPTPTRAAQNRSTAAVTSGPQIAAQFKPNLMTVNAGESVTFTIEIINVGPIALDTVSVTGSPVASCNRTDLGPMTPGQVKEYTCSRTNVTDNFLNEIVVTGLSANEVETVRRVGAFVKARKTVLAIEKRPITQTVVRGAAARFAIVLFNLSSDIVLTNVKVDDSVANDCDFDPAIPLNLAPGESKDYLCSLPNVQTPQTTVATAQGTNPQNNQVYTDSFAAWVDMLGITAGLSTQPATVAEPGGLVTYMATVTNPGSFPVTLSALTTDQYGNILDPANSQVAAATNSCLSQSGLPTIQPFGGTYSCSFVAAASGQPSNYVVVLTARARNLANTEVSATASATVVITDLPASIALSVSADPPFINPPGRNVSFSVRIDNTSEADTVSITQLTDSVSGNLNNRGSCELPQTIPPGGSYQCAYTANVQGQVGDEKTRTITASGVDDDTPPGSVSASKDVTVGITDQVLQNVYMPTVADDVVGIRCNDPYPLQLNRPYNFLPPLPWSPPQNQGSFFRFTLSQTGNVRIDLTNFVPREGQLIVWTSGCASLIRNTNTALNRVLDLGQQIGGTYIIQLINDGPRNVKDPYGLIVRFN
jgi:hypothetical protein